MHMEGCANLCGSGCCVDDICESVSPVSGYELLCEGKSLSCLLKCLRAPRTLSFVFRGLYKHIHSTLRWTLLECIHKQNKRARSKSGPVQNRVSVSVQGTVSGMFLENGVCVLCVWIKAHAQQRMTAGPAQAAVSPCHLKRLFLRFGGRITALPLSQKGQKLPHEHIPGSSHSL